jgi:hypothetical protein
MKKIKGMLIVSGMCLAYVSICSAQAPPGPIEPKPGTIPADSAPPPAAEKKPQAKPRNNILGDWTLNHEQSDDPHEKLQQARENSGNNGGGNRGGGMGGPRIGFPGGGMGGPGMGGGQGQGQSGADMDSIQEKINPPLQMNLSQKTSRDPEVDLTDEQSHKQIFYTDGRKVQKSSKDSTSEEIAAKWEGSRLVTDEKSGRGSKLSRTYELSPDGLQLWESIKVNTGHGSYPVTIRYVYDAVDLPGKPAANQAASQKPRSS